MPFSRIKLSAGRLITLCLSDFSDVLRVRRSAVRSAAAIPAAALTLGLSGCSTAPTVDLGETPASFHDTRLQYAVLTADRSVLAKEFSRQTEPTIPERFAAGIVLPVTAAAETAFWPVSASFRGYHERYCGDLNQWPRWVPCNEVSWEPSRGHAVPVSTTTNPSSTVDQSH